jgi:hypothetical protein
MSKRPKRTGAGQIDRFVNTEHFEGNKGKDEVVSEEEFDDAKPPVYSYLEPTQVGDACDYVWNELEVKTAHRNKKAIGNGLFAKKKLKAGTIVVNLGQKVGKQTVKSWDDARASHAIPRHDGYVDGKPIPANHPNSEGVAFFGLSITNQINEPPRGTRPNCVFHFNQTVVMVDIEKGEELLVFYGDVYNRSHYNPPYIIADETRWVTPGLWDWKPPRKAPALMKHWMKVLEECIVENDPKQTSINAINRKRNETEYWRCLNCDLLNIQPRNVCLICFDPRFESEIAVPDEIR